MAGGGGRSRGCHEHVITGEEDFICGPVCAGEVADGIKGSRKVVVGDSGHMIFVERPEVFELEVAEFLES